MNEMEGWGKRVIEVEMQEKETVPVEVASTPTQPQVAVPYCSFTSITSD